MKRISKNNLIRNILITPDEVMFHAPHAQEHDERKIQQNIIPAEERFIRGALGNKFYDILRKQKNTEITPYNIVDINTEFGTSYVVGDIVNSLSFLTPQNKELWIEHLWKICAECVAFVSLPENYVQQSNAGTIQSAPTQAPLSGPSHVAPELRSVKWAMDKKLQDRIDPMIHSMHLWLCERKEDYPLYNKPCPCEEDEVFSKKKTNIILGIYDEDPKCGCKW